MKKRFESVELVNYTKGEEILNVITHAAGLVIPLFMLINNHQFLTHNFFTIF